MSFPKSNFEKITDPDGNYFDSTPEDQNQFFRKNPRNRRNSGDGEITLNNTSSTFNEHNNKDYPQPYYSQYGPKKLHDMVYPTDVKNEVVKEGTKPIQKNSSYQEGLIQKERNFKVDKRSKKIQFKKYYTKLQWYFKGDSLNNGNNIVILNVGEIIKHFGADRATIRDIIPIWGHNTIIGHTAEITCLSYPDLNRELCTSNIRTNIGKKYFVSIYPGHEKYDVIERKDILRICKKSAARTLLDYEDDNETYPFRGLVERYDRLISDKKFVREIKKKFKKIPKNGEQYIKELVELSKMIPLKRIEEYRAKEYTSKFRKRNDDPSISEGVFIPRDLREEDKSYFKFLTSCPLFEGKNQLRYINDDPFKKNAMTVSLQRHMEVVKLLKLLKCDQGVIKSVQFKLNLNGNEFSQRSHHRETPNCVTIKICVKVNII